MPGWFRPVQFTIGNDCLTCYAPNTTPLHYYVSFVGIMRGALWIAADGQPPNGLYDITQDGVLPCLWQQIFAGLNKIYYQANPANTVLKYIFKFPLTAFTSTNLAVCSRWHFNDRAVPAGNHFYGGYGIVFTPAEIQAIIEMHTPVVDPDPLFKVSPMAGGLIVVSYIDSWGDTKLKLKFDTTA